MKLGKRRKGDDPKDEPSAAAVADVPSATDTWTAPAADFGGDEQPAAASEPPVDSHAVELPPVPAAAPEAIATPPPPPLVPPAPVPLTMPDPPAASYAAAAASGVAMPPPVAHDPAIAMGGAIPADGHAPADPLMDEIRVLAAERPEIVVGAAFAGGILAAMILRRLGN